MYYEAVVTIPANTTQAVPVVVELPVHPGVVKQVAVEFPEAHCHLRHLVIFMWGRQVWPSNPDSDFCSNNHVIEFDEDLELVDPPYVFELRGWNEDDTHAHKLYVRVQVTPSDRTLASLFARLALGPAGPVTTVRG